MPTLDAISTEGLDVTEADMEQLLAVDLSGWRAEVPLIEEHYAQFGDHLPTELRAELESSRSASLADALRSRTWP